MEFKCTIVRHRGIVMPKWRQNGHWQRGHLLVAEQRDEELSRSVRVARLVAGRQGSDLLPPLFDAVLVSASPDWWVMTGFERVTLGKMDTVTSFQQSWFLAPMTAYELATVDASES